MNASKTVQEKSIATQIEIIMNDDAVDYTNKSQFENSNTTQEICTTMIDNKSDTVEVDFEIIDEARDPEIR